MADLVQGDEEELVVGEAVPGIDRDVAGIGLLGAAVVGREERLGQDSVRPVDILGEEADIGDVLRRGGAAIVGDLDELDVGVSGPGVERGLDGRDVVQLEHIHRHRGAAEPVRRAGADDTPGDDAAVIAEARLTPFGAIGDEVRRGVVRRLEEGLGVEGVPLGEGVVAAGEEGLRWRRPEIVLVFVLAPRHWKRQEDAAVLSLGHSKPFRPEPTGSPRPSQPKCSTR